MSTTSLVGAVNQAASTAGSSSTTGTSAAGNSTLASQTVFLQLLIAQLKNQDPANPSDGAQFVAQLAQFTTLEQTTQSRMDLDQIAKALQNKTTAQAATT